GFLVGHSALRRVVMGEDAVGGTATIDQIAAMGALLRDALSAGGLGLSTSWSRNHCDGQGDPVPSRSAARDEMLALAAIAGEQPATQLQVAPDTAGFDDDLVALMTSMSLRSGRPINWNVFVPQAARRRQNEMQLAASSEAAQAGARVWALAY